MKIYFLLALTGVLFAGAQGAAHAGEVFPGEKAIVFETMDGKKADAFEGVIQIPENRANPDSRMIPLNYVRFPATGKTPGSPIIYLAGGPGGSGIMTAKYPQFRFPLFMALRQYGDVIALDQRGTGASKAGLTCRSSKLLPQTEVLTDVKVTALYRAAAQECVDRWKDQGIDIYGYTTLESVRDLDALREHFQAQKITLWGISYGSHLALAALKQIPDRIEKVVIASAEGLDQTVKLPVRTDAYFDRLQQAINSQPAAAEAYPDVKAMIRRVHEKLDAQPLAIKIPLKDGGALDFLFQRSHMQGLASGMIADPGRGAPYLLGLYRSLDQGDTDMLVMELKRGYFNDPVISFTAMSFGMDIASGITPARHVLIREQSKTSLLGLMLNFPMPQLDRVVDGLDLGDDFRRAPVSDVPTLLLTGTLDGRTYVEGQREATAGLSNLTQVTVVNGGHNLFMLSPEVTEVIGTFLSGEEVRRTEIIVPLPSFLK
ncbi:alpha/beta fold hydrolase [Paremcibacter congregatus]|uniref:alpha/beta fold hydrolase n=1 Tax=Paremcibacter congregatus TaxID=2043170 RepID=UPI003A8DB3BC